MHAFFSLFMAHICKVLVIVKIFLCLWVLYGVLYNNEEAASSSSAILTLAPQPEEQFSPKGNLIPAFIVVGAEKSGTTSFYNYLVSHPQILELKNVNLTYTGPVGHNGFNRTHLAKPSKKGKKGKRAIDKYSLPLLLHENAFLEGKLGAVGNKEIRFFGTSKYKNETVVQNAYLEYFHKRTDREFKEKVHPVLTGEASPGYIFTASTASQIHGMFPEIEKPS